MGHPARPQTNADSHVLHIPLVMWAGLGELSRIGELVLNPFIGPRFKTVVMTTDLPLVPDKPVDFGLQYFCSNCLKCARECPCDAIPFGDKVMFNGYEMWKAGRGALYPLPPDQPARTGLRPLHEDLPAEQGHKLGRPHRHPGSKLVRRQRILG